MTPFATAAQLFQRTDSRWVGMNLLDDGTRATEAQMTNTSTTAGARLYELLRDASEELMSAAANGARYTEDEIRTYGGNLVVSIVCGLAMGPILERRGRATADTAKLSSMYDRAADRVQQLYKGERIFWAVPNAPEAGQPEVADATPRPGIDCPNLSADADRYFGNTPECNGGPSSPYPGGNPYYPNPGPWPGA